MKTKKRPSFFSKSLQQLRSLMREKKKEASELRLSDVEITGIDEILADPLLTPSEEEEESSVIRKHFLESVRQSLSDGELFSQLKLQQAQKKEREKEKEEEKAPPPLPKRPKSDISSSSV